MVGSIRQPSNALGSASSGARWSMINSNSSSPASLHPRRRWMRAALVSTVAVLMIVAIGSYGATQSIQTRVKREIESVFLDLRQTFGKAEYRQAELDIWNGRLTISDISVQSNVDPDLAIRIGQLVASNLGNSTEMLSAGHVDIVDLE